MLWKTHIRISNEVLSKLSLNLSSSVYAKFKEGVIVPDKWQDYPHHYGKQKAISMNLQYAREQFLADNWEEAFYYLGVTLHYIQDAYTSVISYNSPHNREWHHNYEQSIEDSQFVKDVQASISYYFRNDRSQLSKYSMIASRLNDEINGKNDTISIATLVGQQQCQQTGNSLIDLNLALKACKVVAQSVLSPKSNPKLDMELTQALHSYQSLLKQAEEKTSKHIINLAISVERLVSGKKNDKRMVTRIKNGFLSVRAWLVELRLTYNYNNYMDKKHLLRVYSEYRQIANQFTTPHINWFNFKVPELDIAIVKTELISIGKIANELSFNQKDVKELVKSGRLRSYGIGKQRVVLRKDLIEIEDKAKKELQLAKIQIFSIKKPSQQEGINFTV